MERGLGCETLVISLTFSLVLFRQKLVGILKGWGAINLFNIDIDYIAHGDSGFVEFTKIG